MIATRSHRSAIVCLTLAASVVLATPPALASPQNCRVTNLTAGRERYSGDGNALVTAIADADPRSTLAIRGLCIGTFTVNKALTLLGKESTIIDVPTIDGDGGGSVLTVGGNVTVKGLRIRDGMAEFGGGIYNAGRLVLRGTTLVFGNVARFGGGIFNERTLVVRGDAQIRDNRARHGGGIYHRGSLVLTGSSRVRANRARLSGGGVYHEFGTVTMTRHASVRGNAAGGSGGGIRGSGFMGDIIILRRAASVIGNTAATAGGGIYLPLELQRVYVCSPDVRISPNDPDDPPLTGRCGDLDL